MRSSSRLLRQAAQAARRGGARGVTTEAVQPLGYIASQQAARAAAASPSWRKEGAVGAFAAASALAALAASASCEGPVKEPLAGLKSIRDAKEVVLYQYAVCPFCNKVIAFLDFHKIPYKVVEVNPLTKTEIGWSEYKKVPILVIDGEQLNDSTAIMTLLTSKLPQSGWRKGSGPFKSAEEEQWFKWVDDRFVHVLTPNLYRTLGEAKEAFDYITTEGNFGFVEREAARWFGAAMMYGISHTRLKKKHNIDDERKCLYETVGNFTAALGKRKFMGGDQPGLADVSLFGMVRAVRGMTTFADLMANTELRPWFERMERAVGASARVQPAACQA